MNKEAIRQLADFIEAGQYRFAMESPDAHPSSGLGGCPGGHAAILWPIVQDVFKSARGSFTFDPKGLADKLECTAEDLDDLCFKAPGPNGLPHPDLIDVTREQAVAALREWANMGWIIYRPEGTT